jgi:hypothetical protein
MRMAISRRFARSNESTRANSTNPVSDHGKSKKWRATSIQLVRTGALLLCGFAVYFYVGFKSPSEGNAVMSTNSNSQQASASKTKSGRIEAMQKYENCSISFVPPPSRKEADWRKPLWVPSFPGSGSSSPSKKGDVVKVMIDAFTGLKAGTKNYHMSMKNRLRRCHGVSETAACTQGHPYVPVGPEKQTENFQSPVVFVIRNIATSFPTSHTDKGIAYHGATGQAPEDQWKQVRDQYLKRSITTWREMIRWWRNADYYKVAIYVPYEKLIDAEAGPPVVQRLADQFKAAGFDVAPTQDISCIWYQAIKLEWARQDELMDYVPGYTMDQRDLILKELEELTMEVQDDKELTQILKEYHAEVLENTRLDTPWESLTVSA